MANIGENAVFIVINADDKTKPVIEQVKAGLQGMQQANQSTAEKMQAQWQSYASKLKSLFGAYLGLQGLKEAWQLANKAAQYDEQMRSLNALGAAYHTTGQQIVASVQQAAGGMVSMAQAADMSAQALNRGFDPAQVSAFAGVATKLAEVTGQEIPAAYGRLTVAAATGRTQTLADMGVIVNLKEAYKQAAAQMGVNVNALTDQEKEQIRINTILDAARQKTAALGDEYDSSADRMRRLKASMDDLELVMGQGLLRAGMALYGVFQWLAAGALDVAAGIVKVGSWAAKLTDLVHLTHGASQGFADTSAGMFGAAEQLAGKAVDAFKGATASATNFAAALAKPGAYSAAANNIHKVSGALNKVASLNKTIQGQIDHMTLSQAQLYQKQAQEWTKEGASRQTVETWLHDKLAALDKQAAAKKERLAQETAAKVQAIANKTLREEAAATKKAEEQQKRLEEGKIRVQERMEAQAAMAFRRQYEATWSYLIKQADSVGGKMGQAMKQMFGGMKGIADIKTGQDPWTQQIMHLKQLYQQDLQQYKKGVITKEQLDQQHANMSLQMTQATEQQRVALYSSSVDMMVGLTDSMYQAFGQKQGAAFTAYKAFSMAQTAMHTYEGAMAAYKSLAPIPIVGPAQGAAAFAAVMATGVAQVAKIASMQPGGSASGASAPTSVRSSHSSTTATAATTASPPTQQTAPQITINVQGNLLNHDEFARQIVPAITKAIAAGVH